MARSRNSPITEDANPRGALAKWQGERMAARQLFESVLNQRENELLDASGRVGPRSKPYANAVEDLHRAETMRNGIERVIFRPLNKFHLSNKIFFGFAVALALLEAPVNKYLFDVALGSIGIFSFLASVVLSLCLLILAHLAGKSVRQVWSEYRRKVVWSSLFVFVLIVAVLVGVVGILTVGRALTSAAAVASFQDMFGAIKSSVAQQGFWGAVTAAFSDLPALVLATVNIGGIFAAMMLAYFTHDPDKDYDSANDDVERYRARLDLLDETYSRAKAGVIKKYAVNLTVAGANFKEATKHVIELKHRLGFPLDEEEDHLIIDKLDTLAEDSELNEPRTPPRPADADADAAENVTRIRPMADEAKRA